MLTALVDEHDEQWRAASATIALQILSRKASDPAMIRGVKPMLVSAKVCFEGGIKLLLLDEKKQSPAG